ncbi:YggS family pyridoxal phosphate-dependent enzyme [Mesohalobacter halotolerans]|uniref:Pyridoxal phosphate homeostasis protein n=1 Tax=Mesohalobacter halotolerans TaxID=1883405 RepID=A0A4U5TQX1_9FLAO|nr:YggS family pyridoxal phosphate-dependent enzyme [Mesohalobacter halotolerans]TKS56151.1 YggS family pyridoxal phosphate-dependent enzyme [Mesohalobacter halotolerans]
MTDIKKNLKTIKDKLGDEITLVAVSKTKPNEDILEAYETGHRDFGENKIQEMTDKYEALPKDIRWHMIGHVQRNKVKYMAKYVHLIHAVDRLKLLKEINKRAKNEERVIQCLLQLKIAEEDSKFGLEKNDLLDILESDALKTYEHVKIVGLMGMATFTDDETQIHREFTQLENLYFDLKDKHNFTTLSMGMSGDYELALEHQNTMVRIGSKIFGKRDYDNW